MQPAPGLRANLLHGHRHPERWQGALWRHMQARGERAGTLGYFWAPGQAGTERYP